MIQGNDHNTVVNMDTFRPETQIKPDDIIYIIGKSGAGKATLALHLIDITKDRFDRVILMSPHMRMHDRIMRLGLSSCNIYNDWDSNAVTNIINSTYNAPTVSQVGDSSIKKSNLCFVIHGCLYSDRIIKSSQYRDLHLHYSPRLLSICVIIIMDRAINIPHILKPKSIMFLPSTRVTLSCWVVYIEISLPFYRQVSLSPYIINSATKSMYV